MSVIAQEPSLMSTAGLSIAPQFGHCIKVANEAGSRSVSAHETIRRVAPLMRNVGVTRVGEITDLDTTGVPVFVAVRPEEASGGISFYSGKGRMREQAQASAMMEAIERFSAEQFTAPVIVSSVRDVCHQGSSLDPSTVVIPRTQLEQQGEMFEWVTGFDAQTGHDLLVPLNFVATPYKPSSAHCHATFVSSSNGLAAGNTLEEAVCQALCEIVERDASALAATFLQLRPRVHALLSRLGRTPQNIQPKRGRYPLLDFEGIPTEAKLLVDQIAKAGFSVFLRDISAIPGLPAIECTISNPRPEGGYAAYAGCGAHPNPEIALLRAITEAAQSRVVHIQGGREDLEELQQRSGRMSKETMATLFNSSPTITYAELPAHRYEYIEDDVKYILACLRSAGLPTVAVVDITHPLTGIPVVRVVVPGAETWPLFHLHTTRAVLGKRAMAALSWHA